ncbi:DEAD/DEAH box helicase [Acetobacterium wieringae]|jgi:ATP-dependent RNA helicase DeaD|uniref:RNA helicase n=1 Tax=Acetobacterium wieringae TaxID=52694 RepID=A0A1F2PNA6_9FIRM|nr:MULTISPECIES: DEAD/DEAH box helicase [Acetobacterium]HAZ05821.1 ATP-dependent RNA helicase [Acetobacterium sp.]MEA4806074.1 DEAD/DEAH box helicase [Acetobacterium wieringae]OFV72211.1 DEAD-box ATP-dependent RNA helicase CshA [Acetobacterium wieringae]TYC84378.1 DEAD/DEAH box helicase [Acetobacterium wieringae]URN84922.1 DEAD/DEAH box helicase [Acetobacterium wieringae]
MKFTELEINEQLLQGIEEMGFVEMTEIQERAIPQLMMGGDLIGKSQTGTGKTVAFAIPAITKLDPSIKKVQVLVLCPTRELAVQVSDEFRKVIKYQKGVKVLPIFGGASIEGQIRDLKSGVQIVVGTPGRVMDHMRRKTLKLSDVSMVVLDEADEMLNMGFREDIELILDEIDHDIQTVLFSATMPKPILKIAETYQKDPVMIEISPKTMVATSIEQKYFNISDHHKFEALTRLLDVYKPQRSLIFCNTKKYVDEITDDLKKLGYSVDKIHGDMRQMSRMAVLKDFSRGKLNILVATDVAARGIDVDDVDIVFNYDVPDNEEYYVHRIGRTGRAGKSGISLTLARSRDQFRLKKITDYTKKSIERDLIPTSEVINDIKIAHFHERFKIRADKGTEKGSLDTYLKIIDELVEKGYTAETIAAVLLQAQLPLSEAEDLNTVERRPRRNDGGPRRDGRDGRSRRDGGSRDGGSRRAGPEKTKRLFISVGEKDHAQKRDILGAICGECGIPSSAVGNIDMYDKFTFVDVDEEQAKKVEKKLNGKIIKERKVKVEISKKKK